jgi:hypothetical protein
VSRRGRRVLRRAHHWMRILLVSRALHVLRTTTRRYCQIIRMEEDLPINRDVATLRGSGSESRRIGGRELEKTNKKVWGSVRSRKMISLVHTEGGHL